MPAVKTSAAKISSSSSDSESEGHDANDEINVDFGFKDINPDVDYQAIKTLLMQTIGHTDATELPTGTLESLAELIISDRDLVGTCIKAEEEEEEEDKGGYGDDDEDERLVGSAVSTGKAAAAAGPSSSLPTSQNDPLALFTVINITHHSSNKAVQSLKSHILSKIPVKSAFHAKLKELFERDPSTNKKHIGLIINERLINMPPQLFPPLLNLSMEEIEWAVEEGKPIDCDYYLMITKIYHEVEAMVEEGDDKEEEMQESNHKRKKAKKSSSNAICFQPEDELFHQQSDFSHDYKFSKQAGVSDSRRCFNEFGIEPSRRVLLMKKNVLKSVAEIVADSFA